MDTKRVSLRIDDEMFAKLRVIARHEGRSANSQMIILVRDAISQYEKENGEIQINKEQP